MRCCRYVVGLVLLLGPCAGLALGAVAWEPDTAPYELLIKYQGRDGFRALAEAHAETGARVLRDFPDIGWEHVRLPDTWSLGPARSRYLKVRGVEALEPSYTIAASLIPNDPDYAREWAMPQIGMPAAWGVTTGTAGMVIAIIDSGVDYTHPDLAANMWVNPGETAGNGVDDDGNGYVDDIHGINAAQGTGDPMDENGHGTHVAGTVGAVTNNALGVAGVNWQVRLMALRFLGGAGEGDVADAIACYNYLVAMKGRGVNVRVANNSWGGYQRSTALRDAIARAGEHGVVSVCAAGNEGVNVDIIGMYPAAFALESSVSVAASDREDQPAKFSNYGGTRVDLAAPGVEIYSTFKDDGYATLSGTSMASPHVAGAAALLLIQTPTLTPAQVKAQLINTVDPVPAWTRKCVSGGRLNVAKALGAG